MAVKPSYRVPAPINRGVLDHEITIWSGQSTPTSLKQIVFYLAAILFIVWAAMNTFLASSGPLWITLFSIWAGIATIYLGGMMKTNELRIVSVGAFLSYIPKRARNVVTRRGADPSNFYQIAGISAIDNDGGIHFADGSVGQVYLVAGSASYLLFDEDRNAILERVDSFWQKAKTSCSYTFITTKEPQRIHRQLAHLERRNRALEVRDHDLLELQNEQHDILKEHVGGRFSSIHQYVLAKASNPEALLQGHQILEAESGDSSLMIKEITILMKDDTQAMLRMLYTGTDAEPITTK